MQMCHKKNNNKKNNMKIVKLARGMDPDEGAYNELSCLDLHCLPSSVSDEKRQHG